MRSWRSPGRGRRCSTHTDRVRARVSRQPRAGSHWPLLGSAAAAADAAEGFSRAVSLGGALEPVRTRSTSSHQVLAVIQKASAVSQGPGASNGLALTERCPAGRRGGNPPGWLQHRLAADRVGWWEAHKHTEHLLLD